MKMFEKDKCEYKGGYIVCGDEIVSIDNAIVRQLNQLEEDIQRAKFLKGKEVCAPCCFDAGDEFHRKTEHGSIFPKVEAKTPKLDEAVEKAMEIMEEIDAVDAAEKVNDYLSSLRKAIMFVNDDFIVAGDQPVQERFDLLTIGNPLELDKEDLIGFVVDLFD